METICAEEPVSVAYRSTEPIPEQTDYTPPERYEWIDFRMYPKSEAMRAICREASSQIDMLEEHEWDYMRPKGQPCLTNRKKKRSRKELEIKDTIVGCLISNAAYQLLLYHEGKPRPDQNGEATELSPRVAVSRSSKHYRKDVYTEEAQHHLLPYFLDVLSADALGWLNCKKGTHVTGIKQFSTTGWMEAGEKLLSRIEEYSITLDDIDINPYKQPIRCTEQAYTEEDDIGNRNYRRKPKSQYKPYVHTRKTRELEGQMRTINDALADADIQCSKPEIDTSKRFLIRSFTYGCLARNRANYTGGRMYRGFWLQMGKMERLNTLTIDGEPLVELDYSQLNPTMLYALNGQPLPKEDCYTIEGFENCRDGIKQLFNTLLFVKPPLKQWPDKVREKFPEGTKLSELVNKLYQKHPFLTYRANHCIGHKLQYKESNVMVSILLELISRGYIGLPIHDAILVKQSIAEEAKQIMITKFVESMGQEPKVTLMAPELPERDRD